MTTTRTGKIGVLVLDAHIGEHLTHLSRQGLSGVSRARKLAAIREYFRFLAGHGYIEKSATSGLEIPKNERNRRTHLCPDEYTRMLSLPGATPGEWAHLVDAVSSIVGSGSGRATGCRHCAASEPVQS